MPPIDININSDNKNIKIIIDIDDNENYTIRETIINNKDEDNNNNVFDKQLKTTKIVLFVLFLNYGINTMIMTWLGFFSSQFFNYGPSKDLIVPFTHLVIDTWSEYICLSLVMIYNDIVIVVCADLVSPWIFSHVMNGVQRKLGTPKIETYILIQLYFIMTAFMNIAFIGVSSSQIDFFIIGNIGPIIAGFYSLWYYIKMKQ